LLPPSPPLPDLPGLLPPALALLTFSSIFPNSVWSTRRDLDAVANLSVCIKSGFNKFRALIRLLLYVLSVVFLPLGDSAESAL
jgi:hypothetical protein